MVENPTNGKLASFSRVQYQQFSNTGPDSMKYLKQMYDYKHISSSTEVNTTIQKYTYIAKDKPKSLAKEKL